MLNMYFAGKIVAAVVLAVATGAAAAQDYPNKPIHLISGNVGGGLDLTARILGQGLAASLGQQVVVENRGAAGGAVAAATVAKAAPDGYTILLYSDSIWILPLMQTLPYDIEKDLAPITLAVSLPNTLVVHPSLPVKSVKDLIALAKSRPGELNYSSTGPGTNAHLAAELFKSLTSTNLVNISYGGTAPAVAAVMGGEAQVTFSNLTGALPHIKTGRLKALGVTTTQPSPLAPGMPTVASTVPGFQAVATYGFFAPIKTSPALINRLNQEIVRLLNRPDIKEKFAGAGIETVGSTPEQLAATVKSERARLGKVIKDVGIKIE